MFNYQKKLYQSVSVVLLFAYCAVMMAATLHVHASHDSCHDHGVHFDAPECCDDHAHHDTECSLCDFLHSSKSIALNTDKVLYTVTESSYAVSHQIFIAQYYLGSVSSRAPPIY